jgi:hypothetical protein
LKKSLPGQFGSATTVADVIVCGFFCMNTGRQDPRDIFQFFIIICSETAKLLVLKNVMIFWFYLNQWTKNGSIFLHFFTSV